MKTKSLTIILFCLYNLLIAQPKYELRGAWVATVMNIDWPSKPGLNSKEQQKEAVSLLDLAKSQHLNAIFLQVRSTSDAIYPSEIEPWAPYLSGKSGLAPDPFYDPLQFWIEEAHKRGIELHAWINPFRGSMSLNEELSHHHPVIKHPDWFIKYNNKYQYDPGNPQCREHITYVVKDLIDRYDIDGIHMDDYFYPYPVKDSCFSDSLSFNLYNPNNIKSIADWRRYNVDQAVIAIHNTIKKFKPQVSFGISPFGVWRNKDRDSIGSNTRAGITNYDHLYADILNWINNEYIDYVIPQIYWDMNHKAANYKILANWWSKHSNELPLFIGHGLYRVNSNSKGWENPSEILNQVKFSRDSTLSSGNVFFSLKHFKRDLLGVQDSMLNSLYKYPSLIPPLKNSINEPQIIVDISLKKWFRKIKWVTSAKNNHPKRFVIYKYTSDEQEPLSNPKNIYAVTNNDHIVLDKNQFEKKKTYYIKIEAQDKFNRTCGISYPIKKRF